MNVYEAIEASPIGVAWHKVGKATICKHESCRWADKNFPDGWQPLYTSPPEYALGEPLAEAVSGQRYICVHKDTSEVSQGRFVNTCSITSPEYTYYADPRPWPKLPEVEKEEPAWFYEDDLQTGTYKLTAEGAARLERLLQESEGE